MVSIFIILIGLALGFLSQFLTKRRDPGAFVTRMIVGLLSAVVGIVLSSVFNIGYSAGIVFEIVVIIVILLLYQIVFGKGNAP
jgi:uncharacterized membrane protein YeaQ/YmgE (transglycosylase-associated protein family)